MRTEYLTLAIACGIVACLPTVWAIVEVVLLTTIGRPAEPPTFDQAVTMTRATIACATAAFAWVGFAIILILRKMSLAFQDNHTARQHEQAARLRAELASAVASIHNTMETQMCALVARDREREETAHALVGAVDKLIHTILWEGEERATVVVREAVNEVGRFRLVDNSGRLNRPG